MRSTTRDPVDQKRERPEHERARGEVEEERPDPCRARPGELSVP